MSSGIEANAGTRTLCLHRISNRSSPMPSITTDCSESTAPRYDASYYSCQHRSMSRREAFSPDLTMRESMQEPPRVNMLHLQHRILIPPSRRRRDDILVERKRNETNQDQEVNDRAYCTHSFGSADAASVLRHSNEQLPTHISTRRTLLMSRPLSPAFMKTSPSQRISA